MSRNQLIIIVGVVIVLVVLLAGTLFVMTSRPVQVVGLTATSVPTAVGAEARQPVLQAPAAPTPRENPVSAPTAAPAVTATPLSLPTAAPPIPTVAPALSGPVVLLNPLRISASAAAENSSDAQGNVTSFAAPNVGDGQLDTAWRVDGDGVGQWVELEFAGPVEIREVRIVPGYAKIDPRDGTDRFLQNRRVSRVRLEFSDGTFVEAELADSRAYQQILVDAARTTWLRVVVLESRPPALSDGRPYTPISEIEVLGVAE